MPDKPKSFSYSKVSTFDTCKYKYKLRYIDHLKVKPNLDPDNSLYEGTACHIGIQTRSIEEAIKSYSSNYPYLTNLNNIEILKLKEILPKAIQKVPEGEYEYKLSGTDGFVGYIDCLVKNEDGTYDILDFKYSNNSGKYKKSGQVHLYKFYFELLTKKKVKNLYYVLIPKYKALEVTSEMSDEEVLEKIKSYFRDKDVTFERVLYDPQKIEYFFQKKRLMDEEKTFEKSPSKLCAWCDYYKYCTTNGQDRSEILEVAHDPLVEEIPEEKTEPTTTVEIEETSLF